MNVVVRAWHWRATCPTAKKLPSLAGATAAILVRRPMAEARKGAVPNILNNDKVFIVYQYVTLMFPTV
jgi:hypothetical protein